MGRQDLGARPCAQLLGWSELFGTYKRVGPPLGEMDPSCRVCGDGSIETYWTCPKCAPSAAVKGAAAPTGGGGAQGSLDTFVTRPRRPKS